MIRTLCLTVSLFIVFAFTATMTHADPRVFVFDFAFPDVFGPDPTVNVLGHTTIQSQNDLEDSLITSDTSAQSLLRSHTGHITPIACPGSSFTAAKGLDNKGRVVGFCDDPAGTHSFFRKQNGSMVELQVPGSLQTMAMAMSEGRRIVGSYVDPSGQFRGFHAVVDAMDQATFTTIDAPFFPGADTFLTGSNAQGHIVGFTFNPMAGGNQGFVLKNGTFTPIMVPGAEQTLPLDINNAGMIVGAFFRDDGTFGSFVFDGTTYTFASVPYPEILHVDLTGITNTGVLVGRLLVPSLVPDVVASRGLVVSGLTFDPIPAAAAVRLRTAPTAPGAARRWCGPGAPARLQGLCPEEKK